MEKLIEQATRLLTENINPVLIYLFGSAARGELREDSDIDLAYLSNINLTNYDNFLLAQQLAEIFNRDVDLINLKEASTVFKVQVIGNGRKIYCTDENIRMNFEMRAFKEYALLNEEREVIMKNIRERGNVYGE